MPTEPNGIITSYTLFYSHNGGALREISGIDKDASSYTVDALGGLTYQFYIRAVTFKPGPNETITVASKEYGGFSTLTIMRIGMYPDTLTGITTFSGDFVVVFLVHV